MNAIDQTKNKPLLESKHIVWIFEAAGQHFTAEIARLETELVRHEAVMKSNGDRDDVLVSIRSVQQTRQDRVDEIRGFLVQYNRIVGFCREMKLKGIDLSAEQFARQFVSAYKGGAS